MEQPEYRVEASSDQAGELSSNAPTKMTVWYGAEIVLCDRYDPYQYDALRTLADHANRQLREAER